MSNNTPDYENYNDNLAFEPKSADDLNEQGRESDVLVSALEKCEKLEKQLKIAVNALEWLEEQADTSTQYDYDPEVILKNIVRDCQEALAKIKEKD